MASKYFALLYSAFATRLILCFLYKQDKQHFVTAHSEFITGHFVFHCTLKNALTDTIRSSQTSRTDRSESTVEHFGTRQLWPAVGRALNN